MAPKFASRLQIGPFCADPGGISFAARAGLVHDWLMYASFFLLLGHLYLSLVHRSTRHSMNAITRGWVHEDWALRHHPKWAARVHQQANQSPWPNAEASGAAWAVPLPGAESSGCGAS